MVLMIDLQIVDWRFSIQPVQLAVEHELGGPVEFPIDPGTKILHIFIKRFDIFQRWDSIQPTDRLKQSLRFFCRLLQDAQEPLVIGIQQLIMGEEESPTEKNELADRGA